MSDWFFDAPGQLADFRDARNWHREMQREAEDIVRFLVQTYLGRDPRDEQELRDVAATLSYANPMVNAPPQSAETVAVTPWGAFPRAVRRHAPWPDQPFRDDDPDGSLRAAEHLGDEDHRPGVFLDRHDSVLHLPVRDRQDEYLEWMLHRDEQGRIRRAIFVAEGYDYFASLFKHDEQRVLELYKEFTGVESIKVDDLRATNGIYRRLSDGRTYEVAPPGGFNPRNRFNVANGIVHLSHRANSLGAEVNLAGVSGIGRLTSTGALLDGADNERLLCCAEGGNPNRNSDPAIAQEAYAQVLAGFHYTLANPVGLYIAGIAETRLLLPDNRTPVPREWWRTVRGSANDRRILRLELAVPRSERITIDDLLADGVPVQYGGQLADLLTVHLFVTRWKRADEGHGPDVGCSATCCRQTGSQNLVLSDGACSPGFELAFPDLVGSGLRAASSAAQLPVAAATGTLVRARSRRLP